VWFRVAQDALHHLVRSSHRIQGRGESSPERMPSVPRQMDSLESWPNHPSPDFVRVDRKPITGVFYDSDSTCGTYSGDLVKRMDAVGNTTCFSYDGLHRKLSITYPSGTYAAVTPSRAPVCGVHWSEAKTLDGRSGRIRRRFSQEGRESDGCRAA
jgi:YD repeat-containing protein